MISGHEEDAEKVLGVKPEASCVDTYKTISRQVF